MRIDPKIDVGDLVSIGNHFSPPSEDVIKRCKTPTNMILISSNSDDPIFLFSNGNLGTVLWRGTDSENLLEEKVDCIRCKFDNDAEVVTIYNDKNHQMQLQLVSSANLNT